MGSGFETVKIRFLNSNSGGGVDNIEVPANYTVGQLLETKLGVSASVAFERFNVKVNRESTSAGATLKDGDSVTVTPQKIEGALVA